MPDIKTFKRGGSRFYDPGFGLEPVPGVTSIIGMLPKEALIFWAANVTAEEAVNNVCGWLPMVLNGRKEEAIKYLKASRFTVNKRATDWGTEAHAVWENQALGKPVGRQHPDMMPYITAFEQFQEQFKPTFTHVEATVYSEKFGYAGSFDWIAEFPGELLGEEKETITVIGDNKTSKKAVYAATALQLNAYANADFILDADGTRHDIPEIDGGLVFRCSAEQRKWELVPVRMAPDVFDVFVHLIQVHAWEKDLQKSSLAPSVGGEAWEVE